MVDFEKLTRLNDVFGIWTVNKNLRVTYVSDGWLIVWDHRTHPPTRYECKAAEHEQTCILAENKLRELSGL